MISVPNESQWAAPQRCKKKVNAASFYHAENGDRIGSIRPKKWCFFFSFFGFRFFYILWCHSDACSQSVAWTRRFASLFVKQKKRANFKRKITSPIAVLTSRAGRKVLQWSLNQLTSQLRRKKKYRSFCERFHLPSFCWVFDFRHRRLKCPCWL